VRQLLAAHPEVEHPWVLILTCRPHLHRHSCLIVDPVLNFVY
jgi:hypothetical protein